MWFGTVSLDSSYATGGYSLPNYFKPAQRFKQLVGIMFENRQGICLDYDRTEKKVVVYYGAGLEILNGADLSGYTDIHFIAWGELSKYYELPKIKNSLGVVPSADTGKLR